MRGVKITAQPNGTLDRTDALELGRLLMKAGYAVVVGEEENNSDEGSARVKNVIVFSKDKNSCGGVTRHLEV